MKLWSQFLEEKSKKKRRQVMLVYFLCIYFFLQRTWRTNLPKIYISTKKGSRKVSATIKIIKNGAKDGKTTAYKFQQHH